MLRRLLPTLLLLGGSALALAAGILALQSIFESEREQALDNLRGRRQALSQYARQLFKEALEQRLAARAGDLQRALRDPLVPARDLLYVHRGQQWLPRPVRYRDGDATPARDRYHRLEQLRRLPSPSPSPSATPPPTRRPAPPPTRRPAPPPTRRPAPPPTRRPRPGRTSAPAAPARGCICAFGPPWCSASAPASPRPSAPCWPTAPATWCPRPGTCPSGWWCSRPSRPTAAPTPR